MENNKWENNTLQNTTLENTTLKNKHKMNWRIPSGIYIRNTKLIGEHVGEHNVGTTR